MNKLIFGTAAALATLFFAGVALAQTYPSQTVSSPAYTVYPGQGYCPQLTYNLYRGLSDRHTAGQVSQLQYFLGTYFAAEPVPVTGYYGAVTAGFVARFQQQQGVYPVTGGVGPLTRAAISRACGGVTPQPPTSSTFYLNQSFSLSQGQSAKQYQGQLDITLNKINSQSYPWWYPQMLSYPYYPVQQSASITLGQSCAPGTYCLAIYYPSQTLELTVGQSATFMGYTVTLQSLTSASATFLITSQQPEPSSVTVSSPTGGQTYARGSQMPITWQSSIKVAGAAVVDLYTVAGTKVGTIAIQQYAGNGSLNWSVPVGGTICTLQYPNGLCGQNLSGQYYIKVSIVSGSGFESNQTVFASGNSGTFTIN